MPLPIRVAVNQVTPDSNVRQVNKTMLVFDLYCSLTLSYFVNVSLFCQLCVNLRVGTEASVWLRICVNVPKVSMETPVRKVKQLSVSQLTLYY